MRVGDILEIVRAFVNFKVKLIEDNETSLKFKVVMHPSLDLVGDECVINISLEDFNLAQSRSAGSHLLPSNLPVSHAEKEFFISGFSPERWNKTFAASSEELED